MKKENNLSTDMLLYIRGLLTHFEKANCVGLSRILNCSHDRLSRVLNLKKICWTTLFSSFILRTFGNLQDGYLIIDDTVINKQFAKKIENLSWVFDSKIKKAIRGLNVVALAWSDGNKTIPLMIKIYHKHADKSKQKTKIDLAVELFSFAKKTLCLQPKYALFDSYYSSEKVLTICEKFKWKYITQVKKNRNFNSCRVDKYRSHPYWNEVGILSKKFQVRLVRFRKKYFITNDTDLSEKNIRQTYSRRWPIEDIFRLLKSELGFDQCESRSRFAQASHFFLCLTAYCVLECEKTRLPEMTHYSIRRECKFRSERAKKLLVIMGFEDA
jgi:putative transposase